MPTTTKRRPTDIIRQQRADIDATLAEFQQRADGIKYRAELSDVGRADARRALRDQYLANLTSDAAAGWKLAQAALSSAKADYRAAHAKHNADIDAGKLAWLARETASRLAAAAYVGDRVGAFDPVQWCGRERDRLVAADDRDGLRALRVVSREALPNALDAQSAARLARIMDADEAAEQSAVIEAQRELQAAENAAADLRRRIETHRATLDPHATDGLAGSDAFSAQVFGDAPAPNVLMSS